MTALETLAADGVLGTLLPGSLLTLHAAEAWRKHLLDQADLRLIASFGDYGLFSYALVNVAAAVLVKPRSDRDRQESVDALVAINEAEATGDALRALRLRQVSASPGNPALRRSWRLFQTTPKKLARQATWRLTSPKTEEALSQLVQMGRAVPISDLFVVRQGVLTGLNSAFLLTEAQVAKLPRREHKWFRPAIMSDSIRNGEVQSRHRVFYPYTETEQGLAITSETVLAKVLPTYFDSYLRPFRSRLEKPQ